LSETNKIYDGSNQTREDSSQTNTTREDSNEPNQIHEDSYDTNQTREKGPAHFSFGDFCTISINTYITS
jgi:hypothetical protein